VNDEPGQQTVKIGFFDIRTTVPKQFLSSVLMFDWTSVTGNIVNIDPFGSLAHPICLVHRENLEQLEALISHLEAILHSAV
jgi:hypothetical protein